MSKFYLLMVHWVNIRVLFFIKPSKKKKICTYCEEPYEGENIPDIDTKSSRKNTDNGVHGLFQACLAKKHLRAFSAGTACRGQMSAHQKCMTSFSVAGRQTPIHDHRLTFSTLSCMTMRPDYLGHVAIEKLLFECLVTRHHRCSMADHHLSA